MPIPVTCTCGNSYSLKDEFAGRLVRCPDCGAEIPVEAPAGPAPQADPAFEREKFLLRQKHFAISAKYQVADEQGQPILYALRPAHFLRNLFAVLAAVVVGIVGFVVLGLAAFAVPEGPLRIVLIIVAALASIFAGFVVGLLLYRKRHVTFYRDEACRERLLEVLQDKKVQILNATYTVNDAEGQLLARLHKNYLYNIIRKRWYCYAPDGSVRCIAKEDSIILSLLRRFLGPLFGFLRTNFIILDGESDRIIGEFNRKFTILDRYVLDLSADPERSLDRRIALALGVMLDTGERR